MIHKTQSTRRGAVLVWTAILLVILVGMMAFAIDAGYVFLARTQLQASADSAAMAAAAVMSEPKAEVLDLAREYAGYHGAAGRQVAIDEPDVELGVWDSGEREFTASDDPGNAVKVTTRTTDAGLFFASVLGRSRFSANASAVAVANPRDIVFVVDLSGSMNDDTEPAWATQTINGEFGSQGFPNVGSDLMQALFDDFGYGSFPGKVEHIGYGMPGVSSDRYAYAQLTMNDGPLTAASIPSTYRIISGTSSSYGDNEQVRKVKAYRWMIDKQIRRLMPGVNPPAESSSNYAYWEKYLDYIIDNESINQPKPSKPKSGGGGSSGGSGGGGSSGPPPAPKPPIGFFSPGESAAPLASYFQVPEQAPKLTQTFALASTARTAWQAAWLGEMALLATPSQGTGYPPADRGSLPPSQDDDRIDRFNNPNNSTFPSAKSSAPRAMQNLIGYSTYVQFMMDHGCDTEVADGQFTPLSVSSPDCPFHTEATAGGEFSFPPQSQPMHAGRRALIAAMQVVKERNAAIPNQEHRDWVSVVTFDTLSDDSPRVAQPLTGDYQQAMVSCTRLQAVGDKGATTATEAGLIAAMEHLRPKSEGGLGRLNTNKVIVLLTDGVPNLVQSDKSDIDDYVTQHPSPEFYDAGYYWLNAPLMQAAKIEQQHWQLFPVGVGLGTDYDFMDRMARMGGTANDAGASPRGSGNPAEYEERMTDIFTDIINKPKIHLVD